MGKPGNGAEIYQAGYISGQLEIWQGAFGW